jgi:dGTPase
MTTPADFESLLAPYAMRTQQSRGRRYREPDHPYRPAYVRDRDRIIHSAAFRRLAYKTQVFVDQPNDHHRTRLTHTLEVVQIARTVARQLSLNEDLTEAVALVHDLGHPPFGHAGEQTLHEMTASVGGFEHNRQGRRLVEKLESRYPHFPGLNLTCEVLDSISLHAEQSTRSSPSSPADRQMLAEAQVVDVADSIAYAAHDIDDALRHQIITFADLRQIEIWRWAHDRCEKTYGNDLVGKQLSRGVIRSLIDGQVGSLIEESRQQLMNIRSVEEICSSPRRVISLPLPVATMKEELQKFLFARVYRSDVVTRRTKEGQQIVRGLFDRFLRSPDQLPEKYLRTDEGIERAVCDYISSMTDRFARRSYDENGAV